MAIYQLVYMCVFFSILFNNNNKASVHFIYASVKLPKKEVICTSCCWVFFEPFIFGFVSHSIPLSVQIKRRATTTTLTISTPPLNPSGWVSLNSTRLTLLYKDRKQNFSTARKLVKRVLFHH